MRVFLGTNNTQKGPLSRDLSYFKTNYPALALPPHHLVDDAGVALDNLHDLRADDFFDVVGHGDPVVTVSIGENKTHYTKKFFR